MSRAASDIRQPKLGCCRVAAVPIGITGPKTADEGAYIYFDHCENLKYYEAVKSPDLEHFRTLRPSFISRGICHVTALSVPEVMIVQCLIEVVAANKTTKTK